MNTLYAGYSIKTVLQCMFYAGVFCHYDHFASGKKSSEPEFTITCDG